MLSFKSIVLSLIVAFSSISPAYSAGTTVGQAVAVRGPNAVIQLDEQHSSSVGTTYAVYRLRGGSPKSQPYQPRVRVGTVRVTSVEGDEVRVHLVDGSVRAGDKIRESDQ